MEEFRIIYRHIKELREKGMKMKDIANHVNLPSSVLSALYATVIPTYLEQIKNSSHEEALEYAVSMVNNISKKRLLASIADIIEGLTTLQEDRQALPDDFFNQTLARFARQSTETGDIVTGVYNSYSLSSSTDALKKEPVLIYQTDSGYINIARINVYNSVNKGVAIISNGHSMYITLNESDDTNLAMVSMFLQLPFHESPGFLRGIYLTLDYSRNPIARRIILKKESGETGIEEFEKKTGEIIPPEELTEEQKIYYSYCCEETDRIRMCSIPAPQLNEQDLITEKKILSVIFTEK